MKSKTSSTVLDKIVNRAMLKVSSDKVQRPIAEIKRHIADAPPVVSFRDAIDGSFGLIAEIKRKSPSRGAMRNQDVEAIARIYQDHDFVRAISMLTNRDDFDMSINDLEKVRALTSKPILRKDFIFDEYQVYEARAYGADAVLLMATVLTDPKQMQGLFDLSVSLGMDVLLECRSVEEINAMPSGAKIYGINSRWLKAPEFWGISRYTVAKWLGRTLPDPSIGGASFDLARYIPKLALKVAESGLNPSTIGQVRDEYGYNAALVGTSILNDPRGVESALDEFSGMKARESRSYIPNPSPSGHGASA
jgi:indole-3-glycerol phosphate synthase